MMMNPKAFLPAFKQTRHGRLFELIKQADWISATHHRKESTPEAEILAFRDLAIGSLMR
ncbi:hypothetical protein [Cognatishimia sp.]|uniref:hypothetical protein n=1 Tax=Cognatishimia sp. TaxID=2211648 RepID=UPI0035171C13|nr:hypothetical protein [Cognatishimia sp.]